MANTVSYIYEIIDRYTKTLAKIAKETRRYDKVVKDLTKHSQTLTKELGRQARAFREVNKSQNLSKKSMQGFATSSLAATRGMNEFVSAGKRLDKTTQDVRELKDQITAMRKAAADSTRQLRALSKVRIAGMMPGGGIAPGGRGGARARGGGAPVGGKGMGVAGFGAGIAATGLTLGLKSVISISSEMEDAMGDIARVVEMGDKQLIGFETTLENLSEELGQSKLGLAEMAFEAGKLGTLPENLEEAARLSAKMAKAFDMMDREAGEAIGSIQAKMGLMGDDTVKLLDSVNFLADNTSASSSRMIEVIKRLSGDFSVLNLPPEVAAGWAGFADQIEVTPQLAASGMRMMITKMKDLPGMINKMQTEPTKALNDELVKMSKMGPVVLNTYIKKVFGPEAGRFVMKAVSRVKLFQTTMEKALSPEAAGSMDRELKQILKRSSTRFKIFGETVTNTMDSIGDTMMPSTVEMSDQLTKLVDDFGEWVKLNPEIVKFGGSLLAVTAAVGALSVAVTLLGFVFTPISVAILAIGTAVAGVIYIFKKWKDSGGDLEKMFESMGEDLDGLIKKLGKLFDATVRAMDPEKYKTGKEFFAKQTPLSGMEIQEFEKKHGLPAVGKLPLLSMQETLLAKQSEAYSVLPSGFNTIMASLGKEGAANVAARRNQGAQNVTVGGEIGVTASNGASIDSASITLDGGANLAYSGGAQ